MKSWTIAKKDLLIKLRDRRGFIMLFLLPLILTAILGVSLKETMKAEVAIDPVRVALVAPSRDEMSVRFKRLLTSAELKAYIRFVPVRTVAEAKEKMLAGKLTATYVLPSNWTERWQRTKPTLWTQPKQPIESSVAELVLQLFMKDASLAIGVYEATTTMKSEAKQPFLVEANARLADETVIALDSHVEGKKNVSSFQYYSVGMLVMFLLFNITISAKNLIQERDRWTLQRLMTMPIERYHIYIGKSLSTFLFTFMQFTVFVLITTFIYRVSWGENYALVFALGTLYCFVISGLSLVLSAFIKEAKTADILSSTVIQLLALLGGSMLPLVLFPKSLLIVANIAPNKWALDGFLHIMSATTNELVPTFAVLAAIGLASYFVSVVKLGGRA